MFYILCEMRGEYSLKSIVQNFQWIKFEQNKNLYLVEIYKVKFFSMNYFLINEKFPFN